MNGFQFKLNIMEEKDHKKEKEEVIKKQATELEKSIKEKVKELQEVQSSCNHPEESIKIKDMNPGGASDIRRYCDLCGHLLGYPTKKELDDWIGLDKK